MKKLIAILTFLLSLYGLPAFAQEETSTIIVPLHYADAGSVVRKMKEGTSAGIPAFPFLPSGLTLTVDQRTNSVLVTGEMPSQLDDLAMAQQYIQLLDAQSIPIKLTMRVIRLVHESNGSLKIETVGTPTVMTLNGQTATFTAQAGKESYTLEITPQVNGDGSLLLIGKMSAGPASGMKGTGMRLALDGSTVMLLGVTSSTKKETQISVLRGELAVGGTEKHTDYYLLVTPSILPIPTRQPDDFIL